MLLALVLAACGEPADTTVGDPPQSTPIETSGIQQIDEVITDWKTVVPATMVEQQVKQETIEEKVYQSSASLEAIDTFYKQLTENGWYVAPRMPGVQNGMLLTGYDNGNTSLVIGAIDAAPLGGTGVIVYTAKGTK
jgi:hypothetical protein